MVYKQAVKLLAMGKVKKVNQVFAMHFSGLVKVKLHVCQFYTKLTPCYL